MHEVIVEPNRDDHRGHSYTIWVTKLGRSISRNTNRYSNGEIAVQSNRKGSGSTNA